MRTLLLLAILAFLGASASSEAAVLIVTPTEPSGTADVALLAKHPFVKAKEPVFPPQEQRTLRDLGSPLLAQSMKLTLGDESAVQEIRDFAKNRGLKLAIDVNSLPVRLPAYPDAEHDALEEKQWPIRNDGRSQFIVIDELSSAELPGKAGEDLQLDFAPAEPLPGTVPPVIVAVLDTGIDAEHPDLKSRIVKKAAECEALQNYKSCLLKGDKRTCDKTWAKFDSDGNGYPLDCSGWNLTVGKNPLTGILGNTNTADQVGHGTHVSGLIAAARNARGIRGVSQNVALLPVKVVSAAPKAPLRPQSASELEQDLPPIPDPVENGKSWQLGFSDLIARGLLYAIRSDARIINLSLAWPKSADSLLMRKMVELAQARGILVVAAAGNDATESQVMPCSYSGVICVASHGPDGTISSFSNFGAGVDLAAPGSAVLSTWPVSVPGLTPLRFVERVGYDYKNGTSMASPLVAGTLARLLAAGFPSDEAYARLLLGARARPNRDADAKPTRFGNADLAGSFRVQEQSLILPESKDAISLTWDRQSDTFPIRIPFKNFWKGAARVDIEARIAAPAGQAALDVTRWNFEQWLPGERKEIESVIRILDPRITSELTIDLTISPAGQPARTFSVKGQISVIITPSFDAKAGSDVKVSRILNGKVPETAMIRTVIPAGNATGQPLGAAGAARDYVAIQKSPKEWVFQLLTRDTATGRSDDFTIRAVRSLPSEHGDLLNLYRLDWNRDGADDYVWLYSLPITPGQKNAAFRFLFLDQNLTIQKTLDYTAETAILPEGFQWLGLSSGFTPAWVGVGGTPSLEKKPYDPWDPNPRDPLYLRFYYFAADGLRTLNTSDDTVLVAALAPNVAQKSAGEIPVLLAKGESYRREYFTAVIKETRPGSGPEITDVVTLSMKRYRMLIGADSVIPVSSLAPSPDPMGTAFTSPGVRGALRTVFLMRGTQSAGYSSFDSTQSSASPTDTVMRVAGLFASSARAAAFTQTQYDLLYHDLGSNEFVSTSMHRFSYLSQLAFVRSFVPAVVGDGTGGRLPGVLVFGDLTGIDSSEVIVPEYGTDGKLLGLTQPARLRLVPGTGCQRVRNPIDADQNAPTQLLFFCGDHFVTIPLTFAP